MTDQELLTAQSALISKLNDQLAATKEAFVRFARKSTQTWKEADELVDELLENGTEFPSLGAIKKVSSDR